MRYYLLLRVKDSQLTQPRADSNDGTGFVPRSTGNITAMNNFLKNQFPHLTSARLSQIDTLYPKAEQLAEAGAYWHSTANAYGEIRYMCPGLYISSAYSKTTSPS